MESPNATYVIEEYEVRLYLALCSNYRTVLVKLSLLTGGGCLYLMHSFSVISANIAVSHIMPKLDSLHYISVADTMCLASINLTQLALNLTHLV